MLERKGSLHGKELYVYDPEINCSEADIIDHLKKFNRTNTLRRIAEVSKDLYSNQGLLQIEDAFVTPDIVLKSSLLAIAHSSDSVGKEMNTSALTHLFKMCHKVLDSQYEDSNRDSTEIWMYHSYHQFSFQERYFNSISRTLFIYKHLWGTVNKAKDFDVLSEIEKTIGITLDTAAFFIFSQLGSEDCYFFEFTEDVINDIKNSIKYPITIDAHQKFIKWCSGTYEMILSHDQLMTPFSIFPVVDTGFRPLKNKSQVYIVISHNLLQSKLMPGIYYSLVEKFNDGASGNIFKSKYGYVFQEYVGTLLKNSFQSWGVIREIQYKNGRDLLDTVDWFLIKDDKAILFEVKQSSIFLKSKETANLEDIRNDLRKTLVKAVKQLKNSLTDIKSRKYKELDIFNNIRKFQLVIVVGDPLYNANSVGKDLINNEIKDLDFDYHIINISDFETLLASQARKESLWKHLDRKLKNDGKMDFKEYILKTFQDGPREQEFLKKYFHDFIGQFKKSKQN